MKIKPFEIQYVEVIEENSTFLNYLYYGFDFVPELIIVVQNTKENADIFKIEVEKLKDFVSNMSYNDCLDLFLLNEYLEFTKHKGQVCLKILYFKEF